MGGGPQRHRGAASRQPPAAARGAGVFPLITRHGVLRGLRASIVLALGAATTAAGEPYALGDIRLGTSYEELARQLDVRDFHAAIAARRAAKSGKPDLGRRGFGCAQGDKLHADIICVSHDEIVGGEPMREVRLQFLDGILQQISFAAEIAQREAVLAALHAQHGAPQETRTGDAGALPSERWRNAESSIRAYSGRDLMYVSYELAGYGNAKARRQRDSAPTPP